MPIIPGRVDILGTSIDNVSIQGAIDSIVSLVERGRFSFTVTANVDHVMKLRKDPEFRAIYESANLVVADGVPLLWAARALGTPLKGRVNGTDLMEGVISVAAEKGFSIYLLGGSGDSAADSAEILKQRHPRLSVAGHRSPPFGFERDPVMDAAVERQVAQAHPDVLFVALGAPKQEKWIARHGARTGARHTIGVGASFSFISGQVSRAPELMQRAGLEWLWRLAEEPRRLWRRYLWDDLPFFGLITAEVLKRWARQEEKT